MAQHDPSELIDLLEAYLLGEQPSLTGLEIADEVGIPIEDARLRWRSLGFTAVGDDVPAFTHTDLEALRMTQRLIDLGYVEGEDQQALVRTLGRSFARLAEWQIGLLAKVIDLETMDLEDLTALMDEVTPTVERLQSYVWRRHTLGAAARMLLAAAEQEGDERAAEQAEQVGAQLESGEIGTLLGVGFADIVGFTRQSRSLTRRELARLVDHFEERALAIITEHGGRIIKTIGDEVLFVADSPEAIARIGLELTEQTQRDEDFPEIRVGLAWGVAVARLGDVLGPVVNVASRLTSLARPGKVLCDRGLADEIKDGEHFRLRRLRRTSVRGYKRLEPWALRRPAGEDPAVSDDGEMPGPASAFLRERTRDVRRGIDERDARAERAAGAEGGE